MTAKEMHYDFRQKLNLIDGQKNRGMKVPEIDTKLNEAQEVFVKIIAEPRFAKEIGFEVGQRTIDDIRTIVVNQKDSEAQVVTIFDTDSYLGVFPNNYQYYLNSTVIASKGLCLNKYLDTKPVQHDDKHEKSVFSRSSFFWRLANVSFIADGIRIYSNGDFIVNKIKLDYIKLPRMIYNADDWIGNTYNLLDGTILVGVQDCELPIQTHREIVDLAVLITSGDLNLSSYQFKQAKVALTKP